MGWIIGGSILILLILAFVAWIGCVMKQIRCNHDPFMPPGYFCRACSEAWVSGAIFVAVMTIGVLPAVIVITVANVLY